MSGQQHDRWKWFVLGWAAHSFYEIFVGGPERAASNTTAWLGNGQIGEIIWLVSPLAFLAICTVALLSGRGGKAA